MPKEIKLCLVYRDMWQSSGKYMPNAEELVRVADPIINMGCWDRIETNGGGFEQIQLLIFLKFLINYKDKIITDIDLIFLFK